MISRLGRWLRILALFAFIAAALGLIGGVFYERAQRDEFFRKFPPIGKAYDVGGRSMNLYCSGVGGPLVMLESANGWPGLSWSEVQPEIARFTRACWYDRAGTGWSDPGPFPRTPEAIAQDLHALLIAAGLRAPYMLVGPRSAASGLLVFRGLYPDQVAGMVVIDGAAAKADQVYPPFLIYPANVAVQVFARTGLLRFVEPPVADQPLPTKHQAEILALKKEPEARAADWSTKLMSGDQVDPPAATLGDLPLIVLAPNGGESPGRLAAASRGGRVIEVPAAEDILFQAPQSVVGAVAEIVEQLRPRPKATAPAPAPVVKRRSSPRVQRHIR